jgi:hypothetical protein
VNFVSRLIYVFTMFFLCFSIFVHVPFRILIFIFLHKRIPLFSSELINDFLFYKLISLVRVFDPLILITADKEFVKHFVNYTLGYSASVPTLAVWKSADEIDLTLIGKGMVIKPTHASGEIILGSNFNEESLVKIKKWLNLNYFTRGLELNYLLLRPKIILEPYIFGEYAPTDYKFHCFKGKVCVIQVDSDRSTNHKRFLFDREWNYLPFTIGKNYPIDSPPNKPSNFEAMLEVAVKLAQQFDYIRIDLYSNGKEILVGELTSFHGNASERISPLSYSKIGEKMFLNGVNPFTRTV